MNEITSGGILYLAATPIGNLEDMTFRAVNILASADLIAAEDTRHTRKLLSRYDIHTELTSYHEHNKLEKGPLLLSLLQQGKTIVVVSDAGLPGIADPGAHIAELAIANGITVSPLPGANAALSALICSGLDTTMFTFVGFLPKTGKKRREILEKLVGREETLLFYESPHHLRDTLAELEAVLGNRQAAAARELTKKFEEFIRGSLSSLQEHFSQLLPRGEFVLVVAGEDAGALQAQKEQALAPLREKPEEFVYQLMAEGCDKKAAIKEAAVKLGLGRRDVYQAVLRAEAGKQ